VSVTQPTGSARRAVTTVRVPLIARELRRHFIGREASRRTGYVVVRAHGSDKVALLQVQTACREPRFSPITRVELLAGPDEAV
jgi:hypothetical protein